MSATYRLEEDGLLVLLCYEEIEKIKATVGLKRYPNVNSLAQVISSGNVALQQQWIEYGMTCVQPGLNYLLSKFGDDTSPPISAFKAAQLFSAVKVNVMQLVATRVDMLQTIPVLNTNGTIDKLKTELPTYVSKTCGISGIVDALEWFMKYEDKLPSWAEAFKLVVLIQSSTPAAEQAFSFLNNSFSSQQTSTLEDCVECSVMLQFNKR